MKKFLLLAFFLCGVAHATDYHFSDCQAGAVPTVCVAGNDSTGDGSSSTPYQTLAKAKSLWNAAPAGSNFLFARGSSLNDAQLYPLDNHTGCTKASPCTFGAYTPSWLALTDSGTVTAIDATHVTDSAKSASWTTNEWVGYSVRMQTAWGSWIELPITSNTSTVLTLASNFPDLPAVGAAYTLQGVKPLITTGSYTIGLMRTTGTVASIGVTISNLHIVNTGGVAAIIVNNNQQYTIIDSVEIEAPTSIGVQFDAGLRAFPASQHLIVRNSYIHNCLHFGLLLAGNSILVEANTFYKNSQGVGDHHIYLDDPTSVDGSTSPPPVLDNIIRNNTLIDNYYGAAGLCRSPGIVAHGRKDGLQIEHNLIKETVPSTFACWGIGADSGYAGSIYGSEGFSQVEIRGNHVINTIMGIGLDIAHDSVIENNYVYTEGLYASGIVMRDKNVLPMTGGGRYTIDCKGGSGCTDDSANPDFQPTHIRIRNNTVYITNPSNGTIGIVLNGNVADALTGSGYELVSNIVYLNAPASGAACFDTRNILVAKFTAMDYNLCYHLGGTLPIWDQARSTLAANQAASFDTHSLMSDPLISTPASNGYSLAIPTGSPAKNAGHPTKSSRTAFGGVLRDANPDIGAYEFGASGAVPLPPIFPW